MGTLTRELRARRGKLPSGTTVNVVDGAAEAVFPIGLTSGGGRFGWQPWDGDYPHAFVTGTTGGGKTRLMERWALEPLMGAWGWEVLILDKKGGGDYWAALANGAQLRSEPGEIIDSLLAAIAELRRRHTVLMNTPIIRPRSYDAVLVEDRATSLREYVAHVPQDKRDEGMRPMLLVLDELADMASIQRVRGKKTTKALDLIKTLAAMSRSAGIHLVMGMQRPDADLISGVVRHNVRSRLLLGPANEDAERMVLEGAIIDHPERALPRKVGDGFALDVGGRTIVRFHADLLVRDRHLPLAAAPGPDTASPAPAPSGPSDPAVPGGAVCPAPEPPVAVPADPVGVPVSGESPVGAVPGPGPSPAPAGAAARVLGAVRPIATGPFVRTYLRARALRHLFGPVASGPFYRDPFLAAACKDDAGYRCQGCGAGAPVEADHDVPLMFDGADEKENLRALCIRPHRGGCHGAKTDAEMWVWRRRDRERRRGLRVERASRSLSALRAVPGAAWLVLVPFLAGLLFGGRSPFLAPLWILCAAWIALATFGWAFLREWCRKSAVGRVIFKPRQPGLDGRSSWDDERERERGGLLGWLARLVGHGRNGALNFRWGSVLAAGLILAGWSLPRWPGWALGALTAIF